METTKRISLYSYLSLKLAKTPCFSYLVSFSSTIWENKRAEWVLPGGAGGGVT
jgi:hypothetical protein